jgi:hypothetical protein
MMASLLSRELPPRHGGEEAVLGDEGLVVAGLDHAAGVDHVDLVGLEDGAEPLGDDDASDVELGEAVADDERGGARAARAARAR